MSVLVKPKRGTELYSEIQKLLDESKETVTVPISYTIPISKKFEDEGKFIVAGYASVEVIDDQNELIPIPALKKAWANFIKNEGFANINLMHSNITVGKVLRQYTDSKGHMWKSGVDDQGLFIVSEIREDIKKGRETKKLIKDERLTGYSIAGEALATTVVKDTKPYTRIDKLELHEISCVDKPANEPSIFTIVKRKQDVSLEKRGLDLLDKILILPMKRLEKVYVKKKIERRGDKWCVVHCTGPDAGKAIKCFNSKKEAQAMHAAIQVNKAEKPSEAWWSNCTARAGKMPGINDPEAFCGNAWYNGTSEQRSSLGKIKKAEDKCVAAGGKWRTVKGKKVCIIDDSIGTISSWDDKELIIDIDGKNTYVDIEAADKRGEAVEGELEVALSGKLDPGDKIQLYGFELDAEGFETISDYKVTEISPESYIIELPKKVKNKVIKDEFSKEMVFKEVSLGKLDEALSRFTRNTGK